GGDMIRFRCPSCQKVLKAPESGAGRKVSCPRCGQRVQIPLPLTEQDVLSDPIGESGKTPEHVLFNCPSCNDPVRVPEQSLGRWVTCSKCGFGFAAMREESSTTYEPPQVRRPPPESGPDAGGEPPNQFIGVGRTEDSELTAPSADIPRHAHS